MMKEKDHLEFCKAFFGYKNRPFLIPAHNVMRRLLCFGVKSPQIQLLQKGLGFSGFNFIL